MKGSNVASKNYMQLGVSFHFSVIALAHNETCSVSHMDVQRDFFRSIHKNHFLANRCGAHNSSPKHQTKNKRN